MADRSFVREKLYDRETSAGSRRVYRSTIGPRLNFPLCERFARAAAPFSHESLFFFTNEHREEKNAQRFKFTPHYSHPAGIRASIIKWEKKSLRLSGVFLHYYPPLIFFLFFFLLGTYETESFLPRATS